MSIIVSQKRNILTAIIMTSVFLLFPFQSIQAEELGQCSCTITEKKGETPKKEPKVEITFVKCQDLQKPSSDYFDKKCTWVANPPKGDGNCHCIIGEQPPKQGECFDNLDHATCKAKEGGNELKACYLAAGQKGKCTDAENKEFTKANGDCACVVPGKTITPTSNHSPTQCAVLQANFKKENPTVKDKVKCTWAPKAAGVAGNPVSPPPAAIATPKLNIPIPGLQFTKVTQDPNDKGIDIPWLAEYATAAYNYLIGVGIIIAIIIMMIGGIQWMTAGGSGRVAQAKEKVNRATFGLALLLGSYFILTIINPDILSLKMLDIPTVDRDEAEIKAENESRQTASASEGSANGGKAIAGGGKSAGVKIRKHVNPKTRARDLQDLKNNSWCKIKNPSKTKDKVPGIKMNHDFFGSLDCNILSLRKKEDVKYVVLHHGRNNYRSPKGTAAFSKLFGKKVPYPVYKQIVDWRSANYNKSCACSSHFTIDRDGTVYQTMDVLRGGIHAVGHNSLSIGVDLIFEKEGGKWITRTKGKNKGKKKLINYTVTYTEAQYKAVAKLVKYLGKTYDFPVNDDTVRGHGECQAGRGDANNWDFEKMGKIIGAKFNNKSHGRTQTQKSGNFSTKHSASCKKVP